MERSLKFTQPEEWSVESMITVLQSGLEQYREIPSVLKNITENDQENLTRII